MRAFGTVILVLMALSAASAEIRVREIPISEEDAVPGVADEPCNTDITANFEKNLSTGVSDCNTKTDYKWGSFYVATTKQRTELCECKLLIEQLQHIAVPRCTIIKNTNTVTLGASIKDSFQDCTFESTPVPDVSSSSPPTSPTPTPSSGTGPNYLLIGGCSGGVVLVLVIVAICYCKKKKKKKEKPDSVRDHIDEAALLSPLTGYPTSNYVAASRKSRDTNNTTTTTNASSYNSRDSSRVMRGRASVSDAPTLQQAVWDDPVILAVRVPLNAVFFGPIFACGGYGEVFKGTYNGETVAIKRLLPARRKDIAQIDNFLCEIKLMASFDHERIVRFIGVAWNSLSDVCAVVEFMENGDLRSVLTRWDRGDKMRPQGFDADKVKIALHIAHALTYLHSLQHVVVHRDLKSKNILLTDSYDAKLTDFGVSRERADSTMTAGVGTSLWMAPEVMMGERYNEKADVFSFGVVLSELDTQQLPYAQAKQAAPDQRLPDSAILHKVSLGQLRISFSDRADADLVQLGYDCVQVDPTKRPTIAEVLHRVHQTSRLIQVGRSS